MRQVFGFLITVGALAAMSLPLSATEADGGYAGSFLQVPVGARPTAMGGAYIAVANDGSAPLYNPAGLGTLQQKLFASSYRVMKLDRRLGYMTLLMPTRLNSVLGVSYLYASTGSVDARNADGDKLGFTLGETNHMVSVLFAKKFERYLSAGIKMSYMHTKYWEMSANSVGFDIGAIVFVSSFFDRPTQDRMFLKDIRVGLAVRSLGASYKWHSDTYVNELIGRTGIAVDRDDDVPTEIGLGVSGRLLERKLLMAIDLVKPENQSLRLHAGAEYFVRPEFALRGGYSDKRLTGGMGYVFKLASSVFAIDYAFSTDRADEGSEHIFTFDILF